MKRCSTLFSLLLTAVILTPALAQETPEAAYQKFVEASKAADIDALLAVSTKAKVGEFHQEFDGHPEKLAEMKQIMKAMAPVSYKIRETKLAKSGNSASLWVDAVALDFFKMNDPKAKPEKENMEVRLVKEGGTWKVDKQCSGKDGCGKEPDWQPLAWGGVIQLPDGTVKVAKGKVSYPGVKTVGKPLSVDLTLTFPQTGKTFSYFLHRSPAFAEIYVKVDEQQVTPTAFAEEFTTSSSKEPREVTPMEESTSYSKNRNFQGKGTVSLLFDLPKDAKGAPVFYLQFTYDEQKYAYEVK